ncbi:MAG TPA: cytochrome P450 [Phenylobacterium sp.]|uniref:cytochrome P450 n=1 Tax=Phenylobacterium sp. TaxID=1871053 RepID=UPI002B48E526|nr:cytochrome P450 [Phenylobacterium sp.]HKR90270.1 cytochrome P450 [Phenylobacterium sp.]
MIDFDPYSIEFANNPYPLYRQLRDEAPVFYHEGLDFYALSRYADVVAAHQDHDTFSSSSGPTIEKMEDQMLLITKDNPEHRFHKALVTKVFTRDRMNNMESFVRGLCVDLLEKAAANDEFDFVNDFAVELPLTVISELIGIPEEFRRDIHNFANITLLRGDVDPAKLMQAQAAAHDTYMELIRHRRAHPRDNDVITLMMNAELEDDQGVVRRLTDEEMAARFMELALAGHETVAKAIPNGATALQLFPDQRAKLLGDRALIPNAVEEILRYEPPSQLQGRITTRDVEVHGVMIPKGVKTMLLTGAATRDERRFENPDAFDVTRDNDVVAIYFGYGIHRCLGIHLARLEIRVGLEELLSRFPQYEVFPERGARKVLTNVRGFASLPCRAGAHA